jgi:hypothetical protein
MRPYDFCVDYGFFYIMSLESSYCSRCLRANRVCELAPPDTEFDRIYKQDLKLREARAKHAAKEVRLRKQQLAV